MSLRIYCVKCQQGLSARERTHLAAPDGDTTLGWKIVDAQQAIIDMANFSDIYVDKLWCPHCHLSYECDPELIG